MHVTLPGLRRFLPALALMLAVSMTPGAPELVENAVHLLGHGDTAHAEASHSSNSSHSSDSSHSSSSKDADEDRDHEGESDEHGCSGTYHACGCHASPHFADNTTTVRLGSLAKSSGTIALDPRTLADSGVTVGIDRPPQA